MHGELDEVVVRARATVDAARAVTDAAIRGYFIAPGDDLERARVRYERATLILLEAQELLNHLEHARDAQTLSPP